MAKNIQDIEGIGPKYAEILSAQGIKTTENLLQEGATRTGRKNLATQTEISDKLILKWVNMCDLFRINGVAGQFAELLEDAGVDTIKELRNRNPDNLAVKMAEVNSTKKLCKVSPSSVMVSKWVEEAKILEPMVSH